MCTGRAETLAASGNEVAGDLPSMCAENVDYCHHTELADAPAARQVKIRLAAGRFACFACASVGIGGGGEEGCLASGCLSPLVERMSET